MKLLTGARPRLSPSHQWPSRSPPSRDPQPLSAQACCSQSGHKGAAPRAASLPCSPEPRGKRGRSGPELPAPARPFMGGGRYPHFTAGARRIKATQAVGAKAKPGRCGAGSLGVEDGGRAPCSCCECPAPARRRRLALPALLIPGLPPDCAQPPSPGPLPLYQSLPHAAPQSPRALAALRGWTVLPARTMGCPGGLAPPFLSVLPSVPSIAPGVQGTHLEGGRE